MSLTKGRDCIFCKIVKHEIPSKIVLDDDDAIAIQDVNPQAPTHILILPKNHVANLSEAGNPTFLGSLFQKVQSIVEREKLDNGYRVVVNTGTDGGQTVDHLHIHVLGGRIMHWPPG